MKGIDSVRCWSQGSEEQKLTYLVVGIGNCQVCIKFTLLLLLLLLCSWRRIRFLLVWTKFTHAMT